MKISTHTIRSMTKAYQTGTDPTAIGTEGLVERIGAQLGAVEEVIRFGDKFVGACIAKIVSCEDHPNADRLHVCMVDDGGAVKEVERSAEGLVKVVCGAPNVRAGLMVVWLPPGVTVPESVGKDSFVLGARELRGVISNGMLASARELTLGDSHDGILEIDDGTIKPGTSFIDAFGLQHDAVIDIENKMFTHRPDCFGFLGVARELAGIQAQQFTSPDWYSAQPTIQALEAAELPLSVSVEASEAVQRFTAIPMSGIVVAPSPVWLQIELIKHGLRPINSIVDYTNYIMILTGQPLHAYDYDKVKALNADPQAPATLGARNARDGEQLELLNGKTISLKTSDIVITGGDQPIGLAGVMGGGNTEVDATTTNIIIEVASFDMYTARRTSMHHGLFTDAVTRFSKGQSPLQNLAVLGKMVQDMRAVASGKVAGPVVDIQNQTVKTMIERGAVHPPVAVAPVFINERLGLNLSASDIKITLENVEFTVEVGQDQLVITAPFWRTDIEIPEDIVEEVGRLLGFDTLSLDLPLRSLMPARHNPMLSLKADLRTLLAAAGANEVVTYSFVHGNLLDKVGQDKALAFQIGNALSPDLQYYRLSLTPSLLEKVHANVKAGYDAFALFEMGKSHATTALAVSDDPKENGLPLEFERLALVFAADKKVATRYGGDAYYIAQAYLRQLASQRGIAEQLRFVPLESGTKATDTVYYAPGRAASVYLGDTLLGYIGEYAPSVTRALKLPDCTAGFEIDIATLLTTARALNYTPQPRFPKVTQDICLRVPQATSYQQLFELVSREVATSRPENTVASLSPIDIYVRKGEEQTRKQITLRLSVASYDRTLTDAEVTTMLDHVTAVAAKTVNAERV